MSNLPSIPPRDPGFQLGAPMEINAAVTPAPKFRLKKFLFFLRRFWWIPLITLILAVAAGVANYMSKPPEYTASASIWETANLQLPDGASFDEDQETYFGNMTAVFQSDVLRQKAIDRLKNAGQNVAVDKNGNALGVDISVYQAPRSSVYSIQAVSADSAFTPLYLNALVNAYLDFTRNARASLSGATLDSISTEIETYETDVNNDQKAYDQYEQSNNLVVLQQESEVAGSYLARLKTELADYQLQSNLLDVVSLEKVSIFSGGATNANPLFSQVVGGQSSPITQSQDAHQQVESLKFERHRLSKYLRPDHPKIVKLDKEIADAQNLLDFYSSQNQQDIGTARQALKIRMEGVQKAIGDWEAKVDYDSVRIAQADNLKSKIARDQQMYDRLSSLMDNVNITRNIDQDPLTVLQPASGTTRSYAKLKRNISKGADGGLAVRFGILLLIAIRDDRFSSVVEVTERLGDNIVGQVPEIPELHQGAPMALLTNGGDEKHMYIESYRSLRSALLYFSVDGVRPKVLLVTSAVPSEGKSTIASNLSCAMALGGSRVLLVDADLRKGHLHDLLGLQSKPGLAELLIERGDWEKYVQPTAMPNLSFIARGTGQRNPGDLFLSNAFGDLIAKLRERYDYVIIDSSPVFAADDSTTLAPKVDGTLFVVRSQFSRSSMVKEALELLYQRQATVLGLILNRMDATNRSYHYYKYSEYHTPDET